MNLQRLKNIFWKDCQFIWNLFEIFQNILFKTLQNLEIEQF